ncbi:hypothetical protein, partial [uncultured Oscillibacter sp.]|uniref:hypothetical protein n=1 Tax=uncultured Oscillibacter sp. TaxID=876091 RepID=UPI002602377E
TLILWRSWSAPCRYCHIQTASGIWFFTYQFVMRPMLVIYPFLILLTVAIPALLYRQIAKASIIERLRQN